MQGHQCDPHARYRTFDGSCNNLNHTTWGRASIAQRRFTDAKGQPMVDYADGEINNIIKKSVINLDIGLAIPQRDICLYQRRRLTQIRKIICQCDVKHRLT